MRRTFVSVPQQELAIDAVVLLSSDPSPPREANEEC